ncbi:M56 family metallopeptidase [Sphingomonas sp.]
MSAWAIETLVATTLLMLLVLAIRAPVRRTFGPAVAYLLWLLPMGRMILPPLPERWRGGGEAVIAIVPEDLTIYLGEPVATLPVAPETGLGWPAWAAIAWIGGAAAFIGWHIVSHSRFCARLQASARRSVGLAQGRVEMIESDAAAGPLAFGVLRKYVAFPADFAERYDDLERDLALAHELGHHARGDLIANWAALVMLGLHWFNPVAWAAYRAFRADQEMACDAMVLAGRHPALRHAYGRAIVKSAHGGMVSATCHLHSINEIKGRLRMLTKHRRPSRAQRWGGMAGIGALTLAGLALTASGTGAAEELKANVAERTGVDIDRIELPRLAQLPAIPSPPPVVAPEAAKEPRRVVVLRTRDTERGQWPKREELSGPEQERVDRSIAEAEKAREYAKEVMANAPKVETLRCGGDGQMTTRAVTADGSASIIVCKDRIERIAAEAKARAERAEIVARATDTSGKATALASIRTARRSIESNRNLSDEQRAKALAGLDQAMAQIERDHNGHY